MMEYALPNKDCYYLYGKGSCNSGIGQFVLISYIPIQRLIHYFVWNKCQELLVLFYFVLPSWSKCVVDGNCWCFPNVYIWDWNKCREQIAPKHLEVAVLQMLQFLLESVYVVKMLILTLKHQQLVGKTEN